MGTQGTREFLAMEAARHGAETRLAAAGTVATERERVRLESELMLPTGTIALIGARDSGALRDDAIQAVRDLKEATERYLGELDG